MNKDAKDDFMSRLLFDGRPHLERSGDDNPSQNDYSHFIAKTVFLLHGSLILLCRILHVG